MKKYDELKAVVAKFQEETQSNSVLDFCVWAENRKELNKLQLEEILKKNPMSKCP